MMMGIMLLIIMMDMVQMEMMDIIMNNNQSNRKHGIRMEIEKIIRIKMIIIRMDTSHTNNKIHKKERRLEIKIKIISKRRIIRDIINREIIKDIDCKC